MTRMTLRRAAAVLLAVGALPYLSIKISWLAGSRVGLGDLAGSTQLTALNAFTAGMDAVAFMLAAVFFFRRGLRAPAWLIAFPLWVGTGLLGQLMMQVPAQLGASAIGGVQVGAENADTAVHSWIYTVVYGGFFVQGVGLVTAFGLYARDRWPDAFTGRTHDVSPLRSLLRPVTMILAVATGVLALFELSLAAGSTWGISESHRSAFDVPGRAGEVAVAVMFAVAAYGLLATGGHLPGRPRWTASVALWLGSGAMFGWGMWFVVVLLASETGIGIQYAPDLTNHASLARFAVGLLGGFTLLVAHAGERLRRQAS